MGNIFSIIYYFAEYYARSRGHDYRHHRRLISKNRHYLLHGLFTFIIYSFSYYYHLRHNMHNRHAIVLSDIDFPSFLKALRYCDIEPLHIEVN